MTEIICLKVNQQSVYIYILYCITVINRTGQIYVFGRKFKYIFQTKVKQIRELDSNWK